MKYLPRMWCFLSFSEYRAVLFLDAALGSEFFNTRLTSHILKVSRILLCKLVSRTDLTDFKTTATSLTAQPLHIWWTTPQAEFSSFPGTDYLKLLSNYRDVLKSYSFVKPKDASAPTRHSDARAIWWPGCVISIHDINALSRTPFI